LSDKYITVNPIKCDFGMGEADFIGHVVDYEGKRMSREKIEKVLNFAKPMTVKELRSFLGLVNYFRDHIKDHSKIVQPLLTMLKRACGSGKLTISKRESSGKSVEWGTTQHDSYNVIVKAIADCPKLYFLDEEIAGPRDIILCTDASDYGYGAYLAQKFGEGPDNERPERPIGFFSQTFTKVQLNWSVPEKEGFGIYSAILHFEHLLRDRHFVLKTDHKNLTFIKDSGSPKVIRWKLAIQEFDFEIEHIEGKDNTVADFFSRVKPEVFSSPQYEHLAFWYSAQDLPEDKLATIAHCHSVTWAPRDSLGWQATYKGSHHAEFLFRAAEFEQPVMRFLPTNSPADDEVPPAMVQTNEAVEGPSTKPTKKRSKMRRKTGPVTPAVDFSETQTSFPPATPQLREEVARVGQMRLLEIEEKYKEFQKVHNALPGHNGVERTLIKLKQHLDAKGQQMWKGIRADVKRFVAQCPCCQKMSQIKPVIHAKPFTTASLAPWDTINIDAMGPFPTSKEGYQHIIVVIDCFTRFVELFPAKSTTADDAAKCILSVVGRYGLPDRILTDGGSQFANETIKELVDALDTKHQITLRYSKEENSMVERANKEVLRHLKAFVYDTRIREDWVDFLPLIQRIINTTVHDTLGVAPAQLLFGNSVQLDRGIFLPQHKLEGTDPPKGTVRRWIDNMLSRQKDLIDIAAKHQRETDARHIAKRDSGTYTEFPVNSYVLVAYNYSRFGQLPPDKLMTAYKGPFRVVSFVGSDYTLQNLVTMKHEHVHVSLLKKFEYDARFTDPVEVARHDTSEFLVERIISHEGDFKDKSTLKFRVRWAGYGPEDDTYEPWKHVRDTAQLHEYLRLNKLARYIPREHKPPKPPKVSSATAAAVDSDNDD
jgi:transposase InsO family protein